MKNVYTVIRLSEKDLDVFVSTENISHLITDDKGRHLLHLKTGETLEVAVSPIEFFKCIKKTKKKANKKEYIKLEKDGLITWLLKHK